MYSGQVDSLDLSLQDSLQIFMCGNLGLNNIILPNNNHLSHIRISGPFSNSDSLTQINLTNALYLEHLDVSNNSISQLDLSNCPLLQTLICHHNTIDTISIIANPLLKKINASWNPLALFQTSTLPVLDTLELMYCGLNTINLQDFPVLKVLLGDNNQINNLDPTQCPLLVDLSLPNNSLSGINLNGLSILRKLDVESNPISVLDLSTQQSLEYIDMSETLVTQVNLSPCPNLISFTAYDGLLQDVNLSGCAQLNYFAANDNFLDTLNFSTCDLIKNIEVENNSLSYIVFGQTDSLEEAYLSTNLLDSLNFSLCPSLLRLDVPGNQLTYLSIKNGNNSNLQSFYAAFNPMLGCIEVDDPQYAGAQWSSDVDPGVVFDTLCSSACIVTIPDSIFKNALLNNPLVNTSGNNEIECAEATSFTGTLYLDSLGIQSLHGIEWFTALEGLYCNWNYLDTLALQANVGLKNLQASNNMINTLYLPPFLDTLKVNSNQLTSLDMSSLSMLKHLQCGGNYVSSLDVSQNPLLETLSASTTLLSQLNTSQNTLLRSLVLASCPITAINLQLNTNLEGLVLQNTIITSADLSMLSNLKYVFLSNCQFLQQVNIANTNNDSLQVFMANNCPQLTCIQVSDTVYMNNQFSTAIDPWCSYATTCNSLIPTAAFTSSSLSIQAGSCIDFLDLSTFLPTSWQWTFSGADQPLSTQQNPTGICYPTPGCFDVTLICTNSTGSDTLTQTCYITVTPVSNPQIIISGSTQLCSGDSVMLSSSFIGNLQWNTGQTSSAIYVQVPGNYYFTITDSTGLQYSDTVTVTILPASTPAISISSTDSILCSGNPVTVIASPVNEGQSPGFIWILNGNPGGLTTNEIYYSDSLSGVNTLQCLLISSELCTTADTVFSNTLTISVVTLQVPQHQFSTNTITSAPHTVLVTNTTTQQAGYQFTWFMGEGPSFIEQDPTFSHTYYSNGIYYTALIVTDMASGCSISNYNPGNPSQTIEVNSPNANGCGYIDPIMPSGTVSGCFGTPGILSVGYTFGSPASIQWFKNGVPISGANYQSLQVTTSGYYIMSQIGPLGCPGMSPPVLVQFNAAPDSVPIIQTGTVLGTCGTYSVPLTASGNFNSFIWNNGQTGNSIIANTSGNYYVTGIDSACDATSEVLPISLSPVDAPVLCAVTVDEATNYHHIIWEKPVSLEIDSFRILKEIPFNSGTYLPIASLGYEELSEYLDSNSNADLSADRYKISIVDTCGGETIESESLISIHLEVQTGIGTSKFLNWSNYNEQSPYIDQYLIYGGTNQPPNQLIASIPAPQTWYIHNPPSGNYYYYRVEAVLDSSCLSSRSLFNRTRSNTDYTGVWYNPIGIENSSDNFYNHVIISPIPSSEYFRIELLSEHYLPVNYELCDLAGRVITCGVSNLKRWEINTSELTGMYVLRLRSQSLVITERKVVVAN